MRRELVVKGRSLGSSADLTLLAPLRPGFVESLDAVTYKTRTKRVLEALHGARMASHEQHEGRLLSDAVERVAAIHSVRVAVLEPDGNVLLAVTFDGPWESYIRVLWEKVGALLDLVFCGTQGYVSAATSTYDQWLAWAQRVQIETGFFYGPPEYTARDAWYWRRIDRMRARPEATANPQQALSDELHAVLPTAEETVQRIINPTDHPPPDEPPVPPPSNARIVRECVRNGLQGLAGLYRLADMHRPGTTDGEVLRRAALLLLREFVLMRDNGLITDELLDEQEEQPLPGNRPGRFARQLAWLFPDPGKAMPPRSTPAVPPDHAFPLPVRREVQAGLLRAFPEITRGAVVLVAFEQAGAAAAFVRHCQPRVSFDDALGDAKAGDVFCNVAFTAAGLLAAGIGEDRLAEWPEAFRQGMAARAGLLGDVRNNHPRRWRLPKRLGGDGEVAMEAVHAVVQLRVQANDDAPIEAWTAELAALPGVQVLAVQELRRYFHDTKARGSQIREHFGYADGDGQPDLEWTQKDAFKRNLVLPGEVLLGHPNAADEAANPDDPALPPLQREALRWQANGSFLVVRKYRQFVGRLRAAVDVTAQQLQANTGETLETCRELVYGQLMGRTREGQPLMPQSDLTRPNRFTYDQDPRGLVCPLHAHIRRAHPRLRPGEMARPPRLVRRSMSYGPIAPDDDAAPDDADRGLVFMAYNASLSEQFEVVQRWLTGGNSTGSASAPACPIVGVPDNGLARQFRFEYGGRLYDVVLDTGSRLFEEPPAVTRLEWGLYLFAPSRTGLAVIATAAAAAAVEPQRTVPWQLEKGRALLAHLRRVQAEQGDAAALDAWKAALEDPDAIDRLDAAALWAAIRADEGGVIDTPFGVLTAGQETVAHQYMDAKRRLSVCGQMERMRASFGEIALGMDDSPAYQAQQKRINEAIGNLPLDEVFDIARKAAEARMKLAIDAAIEHATKAGDPQFEAGVDAREVLDEVLADLSEHWFGLHDQAAQALFRRGATDWAWQPGQRPLYPGHFTALSRYMFQPHPGPMSEELGQRYGQALRVAMRSFVADLRRSNRVPAGKDGRPARLAQAILDDPHLAGGDLAARTMVGVLMGFNPTIIGAVLNVLREWWRDGLLTDMRNRLTGKTTYEAAYEAAYEPMQRAARMRPMPQLGWRTATVDHDILRPDGCPVHVAAGRKVVLGIVSGTQQALARGEADTERLMFGGTRWPDTPEHPHPVHACPGYDQGIAAMLGALAGLLGFTHEKLGTLRPGGVPLAFVLEGDKPVAPPAPPASGEEKLRPQSRGARERKATRGHIMAWGDSWLDRSLDGVNPVANDLRDWLEGAGYRIPDRFCKWSRWPKIDTMATEPEPFLIELEDALTSGVDLVAVLLSGGGNDSTKRALTAMLNEKGIGKPVVDQAELDAHIRKLKQHYILLLPRIIELLDAHGDKATRIITHGYDYPVPRGRSIRDPQGVPPGYGNVWMRLPFFWKGYKTQDGEDDHQAGRDAMRKLIDALNAMHVELAEAFSRVSYVRLTGIIPEHPAGGGAPTTVDWADDLHPTGPAFELMAQEIMKQLP